MDEILHHLRNPGMNDSPVNTNAQWLPMASKWCERISSIHSMSTKQIRSIKVRELRPKAETSPRKEPGDWYVSRWQVPRNGWFPLVPNTKRPPPASLKSSQSHMVLAAALKESMRAEKHRGSCLKQSIFGGHGKTPEGVKHVQTFASQEFAEES